MKRNEQLTIKLDYEVDEKSGDLRVVPTVTQGKYSPEPTEPGYYWCRNVVNKSREIVLVGTWPAGGLKALRVGIGPAMHLKTFTDWSGPTKEKPPCPPK